MMKILKFNFMMLLFVAAFMTSCNKEDLEIATTSSLEDLLSQYPDEITMSNWEEFVDAPVELVDHYIKQEKEKLKENILPNSTEAISDNNLESIKSRGSISGWIHIFELSSNIPGAGVSISHPLNRVELKYGNITTTTNKNSGNNFNINSNQTPCPDLELCYDTEWMSGVSTWDIVVIQQYLNGDRVFDVWQKVAADVDKDGSITQLDIDMLRTLIIGTVISLQGPNIIFVREITYDNFNGSSTLSYLAEHPNVWTSGIPFSFPFNGYVVKTGDVTGEFFY